MMQRFYDWAQRWNVADQGELATLLDELDDIMCEVIGNCESELIDTTELRELLAYHRAAERRGLESRQEVPEKLDWALKKIAAVRYAAAAQEDTDAEPIGGDDKGETPHPYRLYFDEYTKANPGLKHAEAAAARSYWNLKLCKNEKNKMVAENGHDKVAALNSFRRKFKYRLK